MNRILLITVINPQYPITTVSETYSLVAVVIVCTFCCCLSIRVHYTMEVCTYSTLQYICTCDQWLSLLSSLRAEKKNVAYNLIEFSHNSFLLMLAKDYLIISKSSKVTV